ncbi:MAG: hypothetical protein HYV35_07625 [Lentisphaerae bacterium]|nr:hypothetical protein [Lentisphaerota bacterium]
MIKKRLWIACVLMRLIFLPGAGMAEESSTPLTNQVAVAAQWRVDVVPGAGRHTLEIYLHNTGASEMVLTNLQCAIPTLAGNIVWWQFYPDQRLNPGGTIVCQVHYGLPAINKHQLSLDVEGRDSITVSVPARQPPTRQITAISFAADYSRVYVQYQARNVKPRRVFLNGVGQTNYVRLAAPGGQGPDVLVLRPERAVTVGSPVAVRMQFKDSTWAEALVRAFSGIMCDAYLVNTAAERQALGLDADPGIANFKTVWGGDPACYDVNQNRVGASAAELLKERIALYAAQSNKLTAIHYCTASVVGVWDIYGQTADAAFASPYCLSHWRDVDRWLENEESFMVKAWLSARPRPWLYITDTFRKKARFCEAEELQTLVWVALLRGGKGIKYFAYHQVKTNQAGFVSCPPLMQAVKDLNAAIRQRQTRLAPLLPVSVETLGDARTGVRVYTAWAGDLGVLLLLRNLDYTTDDQANADGAQPRFQVKLKENLRVPFVLPDWLSFGGVEDALTGAALKTSAPDAQRRIEMEIGPLAAMRLLWLPHVPPGAVVPPQIQPSPPAPTLPAKTARHWVVGALIIIILAGAVMAWRWRKTKNKI